ncbi:hypothetical protein B0H14DRAFT_3428095 [Mycena olivaceomarginata]|nr:hypothetical protein B0H14DRAFT_3428095 [Mycena olivaceomarginata]
MGGRDGANYDSTDLYAVSSLSVRLNGWTWQYHYDSGLWTCEGRLDHTTSFLLARIREDTSTSFATVRAAVEPPGDPFYADSRLWILRLPLRRRQEGLVLRHPRGPSMQHPDKRPAGALQAMGRKSSDSESEMLPTSLATREMSEEQLIAVARRYESLALEARAAARQPEQKIPHESLIDLDGHPEIVVSATAPVPHMDTVPLSPAVPSGEGTSRSKGKGSDPRNWGGLDFSDEFSESELKAQKEALSDFEEINRMIKQEELPTPPGFFNDLPDTGSIA